jgi:hypothetical protein
MEEIYTATGAASTTNLLDNHIFAKTAKKKASVNKLFKDCKLAFPDIQKAVPPFLTPRGSVPTLRHISSARRL